MQRMFVIHLISVSWAFCYSFQALDLIKSPLESQNLGMKQTVCMFLLCPRKCPLCSLLAQGAKAAMKHDIIMLLTSRTFCDPEYGSALERDLVLDEQDMGQIKSRFNKHSLRGYSVPGNLLGLFFVWFSLIVMTKL